tara:strand:- start:49 stop:813 length:765 start_codon:yes stop_codon:yes gene_type:complete
MISLEVKSELPTAIKWTNEHTKQLAFSAAQALNASVQGSKFIAGSKQKSALNALAGSSRRYLDRPKSSTQKGFRATVANKRNLQTTILPKDGKVGKGYDQNRYLSGSILGGSAAPKDYAAALVGHPQARNIPKGSRLVPTGALKTDRYGNISKANINKIFTSIGNTNRTGGNIFIGKPRGGARPPGVYRRERNEQLRALFIAVGSVNYQPIFPATQVIEKSVQKNFGLYLRHQLAKNVSQKVKAGKADMKTGIF